MEGSVSLLVSPFPRLHLCTKFNDIQHGGVCIILLTKTEAGKPDKQQPFFLINKVTFLILLPNCCCCDGLNSDSEHEWIHSALRFSAASYEKISWTEVLTRDKCAWSCGSFLVCTGRCVCFSEAYIEFFLFAFHRAYVKVKKHGVGTNVCTKDKFWVCLASERAASTCSQQQQPSGNNGSNSVRARSCRVVGMQFVTRLNGSVADVTFASLQAVYSKPLAGCLSNWFIPGTHTQWKH